MFCPTISPSLSSAMVKMNEDGTVTILSSTIDMGQGSDTIMAQIVAEELGVPLEAINLATPETDVTPYDQMTVASRGTFHMGNAVKIAAADAKMQLLEMAADIL